MAYIGRGTDKLSNIEKLDTITFDGSSSYTLQKNSVNFTPNSANSLQVSIDGVVQAGNFTVSGSTIDFGVAIPSTSTNDFIFHYGTGLITTPADGTVSLDKLSATGTKDATTFLRGDNTFAAAGGGKVLQVVSATDSTNRTTTSTSFVTASNTLSLNITPSSSSNKILLMAQLGGCRYNTPNQEITFTIYRNGTTNIGDATAGLSHSMTSANNGYDFTDSVSLLAYDSPATTSSTSYQVYFKTTASTVGINQDGALAHIIAIEIDGS